MFDGSSLPLRENLRRSAEWLARCAALDVVLEIECGVVGGEEDGLRGDAPGSSRLYTSAEDLLAVVDALGTGVDPRYLLAATFGNVHGVHAPGDVRLRPEILADGQRALATVDGGARFAYVFHGASGTPVAQLHEAIRHGVVKVNVDTAMQHAFTPPSPSTCSSTAPTWAASTAARPPSAPSTRAAGDGGPSARWPSMSRRPAARSEPPAARSPPRRPPRRPDRRTGSRHGVIPMAARRPVGQHHRRGRRRAPRRR